MEPNKKKHLFFVLSYALAGFGFGILLVTVVLSQNGGLNVPLLIVGLALFLLGGVLMAFFNPKASRQGRKENPPTLDKRPMVFPREKPLPDQEKPLDKPIPEERIDDPLMGSEGHYSICPKCGAKNIENARYCALCGARIRKKDRHSHR